MHANMFRNGRSSPWKSKKQYLYIIRHLKNGLIDLPGVILSFPVKVPCCLLLMWIQKMADSLLTRTSLWISVTNRKAPPWRTRSATLGETVALTSGWRGNNNPTPGHIHIQCNIIHNYVAYILYNQNGISFKDNTISIYDEVHMGILMKHNLRTTILDVIRYIVGTVMRYNWSNFMIITSTIWVLC